MNDFNKKASRNGNSLIRWEANAGSKIVFDIFKVHSNGTVHSIFNNSFNLIFGERMIHIGSVENGVAPFGIGMEHMNAQLLTKQINGNQSVQWDAYNQQLIIGNKYLLSLNQAIRTNHMLSEQSFNATNIQRNLEWVTSKLRHETWQTGLAQTAEEKEFIIDYLLSKKFTDANQSLFHKFDELERVVTNRQGVDVQEVFDYWIGRGLGLTPSGDDLLTGMCASLSILHGTSNHFHIQLKDYVMQYGLQRTTQVGYEYLYYAAQHEYHSHLIQFCSALLTEQESDLSTVLEEMRAIGHTSGTDTIIGVLLGMKIGIR
ncbi:DUF2877 domain-containing protein [Oceanobacillus polygoni]|uniref:DUF2877 domain-containing protein n=1 Tax=Oceanobacillus polygoni TaxID=1235259 RepID=A0A9X1CEE0_9BACI|nr:DUF2877 domain-containing protein [Oceanobacillus polygoni]MBP2077005.1 hypothetical protein [Oceanobacillus polygoni]